MCVWPFSTSQPSSTLYCFYFGPEYSTQAKHGSSNQRGRGWGVPAGHMKHGCVVLPGYTQTRKARGMVWEYFPATCNKGMRYASFRSTAPPRDKWLRSILRPHAHTYGERHGWGTSPRPRAKNEGEMRVVEYSPATSANDEIVLDVGVLLSGPHTCQGGCGRSRTSRSICSSSCISAGASARGFS